MLAVRLLLLTLVVALGPALAAQTTAPAGDSQRSTVAFSLRTAVLAGDAPVSEAVVALSGDAHLVLLNVSRSSHRAPREEIQAEFVFRDVADYRAWRESDQVIALLADLESASQGNGVATELTLRQSPSGNAAPE